MKITKSLFAVVMLLLAFTTALAQGTVKNPYALKMGDNTFDGSKRIVASFTATEDGDYAFDAYGYALVGTYNGNAIEYTWGGYTDRGAHYNFKVKSMKAGETFILDSSWATGTKVTIVVSKFDGKQPIEINDINPAQGKVYSWTGDDGRVTVHFNVPVRVQSAKIVVNGHELNISEINIAVGALVSLTVKPVLLKAIEDGIAKDGDEFKVVLNGIADIDDPENLYNGNGVLELTYTVPPVQAVLTGVSNTINVGTLKTFYVAGDPDAVFSLSFDKPIMDNPYTSVSLKGGSAELEGNLFFYEELPFKVEDNTISVDLSGKIRTLRSLYNQADPASMIGLEDFLSTITLSFNGVMDTNGNYVNSPGQGTTGSYAYDLNLTSVDMSDFFMDLGTPTDEEDPAVVNAGDELIFWFSDPTLFTLGTPMGFDIYQGETLVKNVWYREVVSNYDPEFEYTEVSVVVHDDAPIAFSEMDGGSAITLTLPELDIPQGSVVKIVVNGIVTADGRDYDFSAVYKYGEGEPVAALPGDANNDGKVDVLDIVAIAGYILTPTDEVNKTNADFNNDEEINVLDIVSIASKILGE